MSALTNSQGQVRPLSRVQTVLPIILVAGLLVAYGLPWTISYSAGLSMNAYDLAEWSSLHPDVRAASPPFLTTLFLRLPLMCIAVLIGWLTPRLPRGLPRTMGGLAVGLIAVALLPPFEFLTVARDDANYRQQFMLALLAFFGGGLGLTGWLKPLSRWTLVVVGLLSAAVSAAGINHVYGLLQGFDLPIWIGIGAPLSIGFALILAANEVVDFWHRRERKK